jgi:hypothetical protein
MKKRTTGVIYIILVVISNLTIMLIRNIAGVEANPIPRDYAYSIADLMSYCGLYTML